jgi:uncharacterized RDD family membrane protein YckC
VEVTVAYCQVCGTQEVDGQRFCAACGSPSSSNDTPVHFPGIAQLSTVVTTPGQNVAGFWWRFGGFVIDAIILAILVTAPLHATTLPFYEESIIQVVAAFLYFGLFVNFGGATLGMRALRMRCVSGDGSSVTSAQALTRALVYCVLLLTASFYQLHEYKHPTTAETHRLARQLSIYLLLAIPHYLDLLWAAWDTKRQTLHDKAAGTIVVRLPSS